MQKEVIYILHKNGAKNHYIGLEHLLNSKNIVLKHREFSVLSKLFKSIVKFNFKLFKKQLVNLIFILKLYFTKNKKIVLGIAPFDRKISRLLSFLKNHKVYYHTSWACWDKSFQPKNKNLNAKVFETWRYFLEEFASEIFAVSSSAKKSLLENYNLKENHIHVVAHAIDHNFETQENRTRITKSFIYLGRLLEEKGLQELLDLFSKKDNLTLTIVGKGKLEDIVSSYAQNYENINFHHHISDKQKLSELLSTHEFVILNSKKTKKWEELFGMILIEGMAHGLIPVAPNHPGPKEIITPEVGYLFDEGEVEHCINRICSEYPDCKTKSELAKAEVNQYYPNKIALKWQPILS